MRLSPHFGIITLATLAAAAFTLAGCHQAAPEAATPAAVIELQEGELQASQTRQFPLVEIEGRAESDDLEANATVAAEASRTVAVVSQLAGVLVETRAQLGDTVRAGQVLGVVRSADLQQGYSDFRTAVSDDALAQAQLARQQDLLTHGAAAIQDVEVARAAAVDAAERVRASRQKLLQWGAAPGTFGPAATGEMQDEVSILAPRAGVLIAQDSAGGAVLPTPDAQQTLFTIADLSQVWVLCDVYQNDLARVEMGEPAEVAIPSLPGPSFAGRVSNISGVLDPATRAAQVRVVLDNPGGRLRPGMYGTATLRSRDRHEVLLVPQTAVMRSQTQSLVYVSLGGGRFRPVPVETGSVESLGANPDAGGGGGLMPIRGAVQAGQRVVGNALDFANALENGSGS